MWNSASRAAASRRPAASSLASAVSITATRRCRSRGTAARSAARPFHVAPERERSRTAPRHGPRTAAPAPARRPSAPSTSAAYDPGAGARLRALPARAQLRQRSRSSDGRDTHRAFSASSRSDGRRSPRPLRIPRRIEQDVDLPDDPGGQLFRLHFFERHGSCLAASRIGQKISPPGRCHERPGARPASSPPRSRSAVRDDDDLDPAVLRPALGREVRGDRLVLAAADRASPG